jgi:hypothetical protein
MVLWGPAAEIAKVAETHMLLHFAANEPFDM